MCREGQQLAMVTKLSSQTGSRAHATTTRLGCLPEKQVGEAGHAGVGSGRERGGEKDRGRERETVWESRGSKGRVERDEVGMQADWIR